MRVALVFARAVELVVTVWHLTFTPNVKSFLNLSTIYLVVAILVSYTPAAAGVGSTSALGFTYATSTLPAGQALTSNTTKNWNSTTLPAGVWLATIAIQLTASGGNATVSSLQYGLYTSTTGLTARTLMSSSTANETLTLTGGQGYSYSISFIINQTLSSQTYFFNTNVVYTVATGMSGVYTYQYTRVA